MARRYILKCVAPYSKALHIDLAISLLASLAGLSVSSGPENIEGIAPYPEALCMQTG